MIAKLIPTRFHGVLDYLFGVLYIALPFLLNWPQPAAGILIALGAGTLLYSVLTRYELGLVKLLPMPAHLAIDLLGGLLLVAAPLLGLVDESVRGWFWALGAIQLVIALLSDTQPSSNEAVVYTNAGYTADRTVSDTGSYAGGSRLDGSADRSVSMAAESGLLTAAATNMVSDGSGLANPGLDTDRVAGDTLMRDTGPDQDGRLDNAPAAAESEGVNWDDGMGGGNGYAAKGLTEVGVTPAGTVIATNADPLPLPEDTRWSDANRNEAVGFYGETPDTRREAEIIDRSRRKAEG